MRTELYWIPNPGSGRLAIGPRPRGGDWLDDEIRAWRDAGVRVVVSLLTPEEVELFCLEGEAAACRTHGVEFLSFPIPDRGVPASRNDFSRLITTLEGRLAEGKGVAIHCRQGIGRAALAAICVLARSGEPPEVVRRRVGAAHGRPVPETPEQQRWSFDFADAFAA